ncbi:MAG: ATP-binding cassette domain-containing protein [Acidimicrobiia bacterium]
MPSLHFVNLSFRHTSAVPLFDDVTVHLGPGWHGLVGATGSGKTTLLRLVTGELEPVSGIVSAEPVQPSPTLCDQSVEHRTDEISSFAASSDGQARQLHGRLRLNPTDLERWPTLSPGERKRWQIGAALAAQPLVLLLDEPTNHLDREGREVLLGALRRFTGMGVIVSHDRHFLDALTSSTLLITGGSVRQWNAPYSQARQAWEAEATQRQENYETVKREARKLKRRVADKRRRREALAARHRRTIRQADGKDHDARSMEVKGRAESGSRRADRELETTRSRLERVVREVESYDVLREVGRSLFIDYAPAPKARLATLTRPLLQAGGHTVLEQIDVELLRGDRIRVAGPNGAGKSTLLAALIEAAALPADRRLHLPQEMSAADGKALLESVRALPKEQRGRVLSLVAALGLDPDLLLASSAPSPGEARKLKMAYGLGLQVWALVLDEPTNHLDLQTIERLEAALVAYPGALVMVTHDDALAAACTTQTWELAKHRLTLHHH